MSLWTKDERCEFCAIGKAASFRLAAQSCRVELGRRTCERLKARRPRRNVSPVQRDPNPALRIHPRGRSPVDILGADDADPPPASEYVMRLSW